MIKNFFVLFSCFLIFSCQKYKSNVYSPKETVKYRYNSIPSILPTNAINPKTGLFSVNELKVGLLLPMTGEKKEIGRQIFDAITMAIQDLKADNIKLFIFDTANDSFKTQIAAKQAISIGANIIIGPVFSSETKAAKQIIEPFRIPMISLSNNVVLASPTTYIFGVSPDNLVKTSFDYLSQLGKKNIGVLLANTKNGFILGKYLSRIAQLSKINIMSTEYYPSGNAMGINNSVHKLMSKKSLYYLIDKQGNEYLDTINNKKKSKTEDMHIQRRLEHMNAIYLDATDKDLYKIIAEIKRKIIDENIMIIADQSITDDTTILRNPLSENIFFVTTAAPYIYDFNVNFENIFHYTPLRITALAYDAFCTVVTVSNKYNDKKSFKQLSNDLGFSGIYGDFRFKSNGLVERKYYVERIHKKTVQMVEKINIFM